MKRISAFGFRRFKHYRIRALLYAGKPNWYAGKPNWYAGKPNWSLLNTLTPP